MGGMSKNKVLWRIHEPRRKEVIKWRDFIKRDLLTTRCIKYY
jgi:hypothetical protein